MLTKLTVVLGLSLVIVTGARADSASDFGSTANDQDGGATVTVHARDTSNTPGTGGVGAAGKPCVATRSDGQQVPCTSDLGWFSPAYDCYLRQVEPSAEGLALHPGMDAFVCDPGPLGWAAGGPTDVSVWLPQGTVGIDPAVLAEEAISSMGLQGVTIGIAPPANAVGLVNAPMWLWAADPGPTTWGPISATAAAGAVSVTATATATGVAWDMGDGTVVNCERGVPYTPSMDPTAPPCGHVYRRSGQWAVTATTQWIVDWTATTGRTGTETVQTTTSTVLTVREARALITDRA